MIDMKLVILESPYAGNVKRHVRYAQLCVFDSLQRGEAPIASHLLYTQMLDDNILEERNWGINAGLAWRKAASHSVVYTDFGITSGMKYGIKAVQDEGNEIEYRTLSPEVVAQLIVDFPD